MQIEVVDNCGVTSMAGELVERLENCTLARMATASLTKDGVTAIENAISLDRRGLKVKLLVGLYNGHTEAAAFRRLLSLQKRAGSCLEVRVARNPRFHWKVYLFNTGRRFIAYIGSSNLTRDGLGTEGEFNLRISGVVGDRPLRNISETFDRAWRRDAVPLTEKISDNFAPISQRSLQLSKQIDPNIREVLRTISRPKTKAHQPRSAHSSVFTFVEEFAEPSTKKEVRKKQRWDAKGWEWMVFRTRAARDRLFNAGSFYLAEIHRADGVISLRDVCEEDEFGTEDGRFFVAYQKRRGSVARRLNKRTLKLLKDGGLIVNKDDLRQDRRIGKANRDLLNRLLRVSN